MRSIVSTPIRTFHTITWNGKDIRLTDRQYRGWKYENKIESKLEKWKFVFERHDLGCHKKCDFLVFGYQSFRLRNPIHLEVKYSRAKIFGCWVRRDYISRFPKNAKYKIIVTNTELRLNQQAIDLLNEHGIKRVYDFQLKSYLEDLIFKEWLKERGLSASYAWLGGVTTSGVLKYNNSIVDYPCSSHPSYGYFWSRYVRAEETPSENSLGNREGEHQPEYGNLGCITQKFLKVVYHPWIKKPRILSKKHLQFCNRALTFLVLRGMQTTLVSLLLRTHRLMSSASTDSNSFALNLSPYTPSTEKELHGTSPSKDIRNVR